MNATIPLNHVVCPHCNGGNILGAWENGHCPFCNGEGSILNPLIDEWRWSENPARLIELLGEKADKVRLLAFTSECERLFQERNGHSIYAPISHNYWMTLPFTAVHDKGVKGNEACNILRCLWPNPHIERERVECPGCDGKRGGFIPANAGRNQEWIGCSKCKGVGAIESPLIDPRWLSSTVIDLAKEIRGSGPNGDWPSGGDWTHSPPRPELMPILGDALLDAGCDDDEVIEHCMGDGPHVAGCFVLEAILPGV